MASDAVETAQGRVSKLESAVTAARLEVSRAAADAARARSSFDRAEKTYQRQKMLHGEGATPRLAFEKAEREFEQARTEYETLAEVSRHSDDRVQTLLEELQTAKKILQDKQAQLDSAQTAIAAAEIRSPMDGLIVGRKGEPGASVQEMGEDLFVLAPDTLSLVVVLEPEPPTLERIRPGQPALVLVPDLQDEGITGSVLELQGNQVLVEFTNPNPAIRPGMVAEVRIHLG
jgi:HlyD family secretion protein